MDPDVLAGGVALAADVAARLAVALKKARAELEACECELAEAGPVA
jgi:hypothetical protein